MKVLVLRGGAIGDFIVTVPALRAVRRQWPEATLALAGYPRTNALARACGLADEVLSLNDAGAGSLFSRDPVVPGKWQAIVRDCDIVLNYLHDPDGTVLGNLRQLATGKLVSASPMVETEPASDHFLAPLQELGISAEQDPVPKLALPEPLILNASVEVDSIGPNAVALHPGSGSAAKNWPVENFVSLASRLRQQDGLDPLFILGEADHAASAAISMRPDETPMIVDRELIEIAAILANCRAYVGNDSGITHLAAALGVPVVAIFGPTDPSTWGPRGCNVRIVGASRPSSEALAGICVADVAEALLEVVKPFLK